MSIAYHYYAMLLFHTVLKYMLQIITIKEVERLILLDDI